MCISVVWIEKRNNNKKKIPIYRLIFSRHATVNTNYFALEMTSENEFLGIFISFLAGGKILSCQYLVLYVS